MCIFFSIRIEKHIDLKKSTNTNTRDWKSVLGCASIGDVGDHDAIAFRVARHADTLVGAKEEYGENWIETIEGTEK